MASSSNLDDFVRRAEAAEEEVEDLLKELEELEPQVKAAAERRKGGGGAEAEEVPEELAKLRTENSKLKYRLGILQRATERELARGKGGEVATMVGSSVTPLPYLSGWVGV